MICLAKQPIVDRSGDIAAYEVLARVPGHDHAPEFPTEDTTRQTIEQILQGGVLSPERPSFVNVSGRFLLGHGVRGLPADQVVLEILEHSAITDALVASCRRLVDQGYVLALDDFVYTDAWEPLIDLAKIVKVDLQQSGPAGTRALADRLRGRVTLLAEKVETAEELEACRTWGFELFQGYWCGRPLPV